jgi:uncharacterized Fe-S cluster protein YjdI
MAVHYLEIVSNDADGLTRLYQRMRGLVFSLVLLAVGCSDGRTHGICEPAADICDECAFSQATMKQAAKFFNIGKCPYLNPEDPSASFPAWHPDGTCPSGALGGCTILDRPSGDQITRFYYRGIIATTSDDVRRLCGTDPFVVSPRLTLEPISVGRTERDERDAAER